MKHREEAKPLRRTSNIVIVALMELAIALTVLYLGWNTNERLLWSAIGGCLLVGGILIITEGRVAALIGFCLTAAAAALLLRQNYLQRDLQGSLLMALLLAPMLILLGYRSCHRIARTKRDD